MINVKNYTPPPFDRDEILRYAGVREKSDEIVELLNEAIAEAEKVLTYRACWGEFALIRDGNTLDFGFGRFESSALAKSLADCRLSIVFATTVGIGLDRLIAKYGTASPAKALMLQAIGAERIESLCDAFCREVKAEHQSCETEITRRFSLGYGDLKLEAQKDIFRALDCSRKIGLTLNESLIMSPSKSVTAIIGIKNGAPHEKEADACELCGKADCLLRRNK